MSAAERDPAELRATPAKSWWSALWLIIPSLLVTILAWQQFHSVPIAYVALLTTWLFALVALAATSRS